MEEKSRVTMLKFLFIILPMWLSAKFFNGPYMEFVRTYVAAIILVILLALIVQMILPKAREKGLLVSIFLILSLLQIAQALMPDLLTPIQFTIGTTTFFGMHSINLIPYYGVGGFIGYFVLKGCRKKQSVPAGQKKA